jgi:hypothetical protein
LRTHGVHEFGATDALGEAWEVFDVGGGGELTTGSNAIGEEAFIKDGCSVTNVSIYSNLE